MLNYREKGQSSSKDTENTVRKYEFHFFFQISCNVRYIVPLIVRGKKINHTLSVRFCFVEIKDPIRKSH